MLGHFNVTVPMHASGFSSRLKANTHMPIFTGLVIESVLQSANSSPELDHRKSTLARGSRWDYTPLPFQVGIPT